MSAKEIIFDVEAKNKILASYVDEVQLDKKFRLLPRNAR